MGTQIVNRQFVVCSDWIMLNPRRVFQTALVLDTTGWFGDPSDLTGFFKWARGEKFIELLD